MGSESWSDAELERIDRDGVKNIGLADDNVKAFVLRALKTIGRMRAERDVWKADAQRARHDVNPSTVTLPREVVEKVREAMIAARAALLSVDRRGLANTRIESHAMTNALAALEAAAPTAATNAGGGQ